MRRLVSGGSVSTRSTKGNRAVWDASISVRDARSGRAQMVVKRGFKTRAAACAWIVREGWR
jgi:hypothetical protein